MKPRFVVREYDNKWRVVDLHVGASAVEYHPTRKSARDRARKLNALNAEWKADAEGKPAE